MSVNSVSAVVISDMENNPSGFDLVYKRLEQYNFVDIQHIDQNAWDLRSNLSFSKQGKLVSILLIDSRNDPFLFDYGHIKKTPPKEIAVFLKYHKSLPTQAIGMQEDGRIHLLTPLEKKEWADAFSFGKAAFMSQEQFIFQLSNCKDPDELFDSLILHSNTGVPMPEIRDMSSLKPCLFLDRDGILNEDTGYVSKVDDLKLIEEVIPLIAWAKEQGWYVVVISNQSGLARGKFSDRDLQALTNELSLRLRRSGSEPDAWFYCPFYEHGSVPEYALKSVSRKPLPGLFLQAALKLPIDFDKSYMIGDKISDCVPLAGMQSFVVNGQYPLLDKAENAFETLRDALSYLRVKALERAKP